MVKGGSIVTRKTKKSGNGFKYFSIVLCVLVATLALWFVFELLKLNVLTTQLNLIAVAIIILVAALVIILQLVFTNKTTPRVLITILMVFVIGVYGIGSFYLTKTNSLFDSVTSDKNEISTTVSVLVMNDNSEMQNEQSLTGKNVGVLSSIQKQATDQCVSDLNAAGVTFTQTGYDSIPALAQALYNGEVSAIIMTDGSIDNFVDSVADYEESDDASSAGVNLAVFKNFSTDTRTIYTTTYTTTKESTTVAVDDITQNPFTILISGVDSRNGFAEASRSDSNMLMTVNPKTHVILLTSIPRDYYLTTACDDSDGCMQGAKDKLTHTGLHGIDTTKKTLEQALGITINYTLKVNFNTVIDLVDALGGIQVTVEPGLAVSNFWNLSGFSVSEGVNTLNGEQALAFARERYAYQDGDRQRIKNQQLVIEGILKKAMSPAILTNYASLMDALSGSFITDVNLGDIQALIKMQLSDNPDWTILTYSLDGTGSNEYCAELGNNAYVMIPDPETEAAAKAKIDAVISGESADQIEAAS